MRLKNLFLKEMTRWDSGSVAVPLARKDGDPAQDAFIAEILKLGKYELSSHWLSLKQRTGKAAPRVIVADRILFKMISRYKGAFGVVAAEKVTSIPPGTRVLFRFRHG